VTWTALGFAIVTLLWVVKGAFGLGRKVWCGGVRLDDEERAPLVGGN